MTTRPWTVWGIEKARTVFYRISDNMSGTERRPCVLCGQTMNTIRLEPICNAHSIEEREREEDRQTEEIWRERAAREREQLKHWEFVHRERVREELGA